MADEGLPTGNRTAGYKLYNYDHVYQATCSTIFQIVAKLE